MNMNLIHKVFLLGGLVGAVLLFSCSDVDSDSYCPEWYGFSYKTGSYPNYVEGKKTGIPSLNRGDSIHLTACQQKRGHLINGTDYEWILCYDTLDTNNNDDPSDDVQVHVQKVYRQHTNYDGYEAGYVNGKTVGSADPLCHMLLPENALTTEYGKPDTIKFKAYYNYSGQGISIDTGSLEENTSSYYNGRIIPQSSAGYGGAVGYFYLYVQ